MIESIEESFDNASEEDKFYVLPYRCGGIFKYMTEKEWEKILPKIESKSEEEKQKILKDHKNPEKNYYYNGMVKMGISAATALQRDLNYNKEDSSKLSVTQITEWSIKYHNIKDENFIKKDLDFCKTVLDAVLIRDN